MEGTFDRPFYSSPVLDPNRHNTRAVSHIWYTSQGYGELLNPYNASGVPTNNKPDHLDMWDQPGGGAFKRKNGALIRRVEKMLSFQTWLVATKTGIFSSPLASLKEAFIPKLVRTFGQSVSVLAHVPAFSLMFWFETTGRPKHPYLAPPFEWGVYGENGFFPTKKINHRIKGLGPVPTVQPALGAGGRFPVMIGPAAIEQATNWLGANGLHL